MSRSSRRQGFTLVELLVVIAIIGVLVSLLLPAVQMARESARRMSCSNNMRQVALASHNHHDTMGAFPYATLDRQPNETTASYYTGFIQLMPFIESDALARRWDPKLPRNSAVDTDGDGFTNAILQQKKIPTYTCPSMVAPTGTLGGTENRGPCSYLFSAGTTDATLYAYWSSFGLTAPPLYNGAIIPLNNIVTTPTSPNTNATGMRDIIDGTSNTFLLGETDFAPRGVPSTEYGGIWAYGYIGYTYGTTFLPFNNHKNTTTVYGAFRSQHPNGAQFAMCDGSVRFVAQNIDFLTYQAVSTRFGGEVNTLQQ